MVPVATMTPVTAMLHLVMVLVAHLIVTTVIVVARVCVAVGHVLVTFVVLVARLTVALVMFVVIVVHLTVTAMLHLVMALVTAMVHTAVIVLIVVARVCVAVGHVLVTSVVLVAHLTVALVMFVVIVVHLTVTAMLHLVIVLVTAMVLVTFMVLMAHLTRVLRNLRSLCPLPGIRPVILSVEKKSCGLDKSGTHIFGCANVNTDAGPWHLLPETAHYFCEIGPGLTTPREHVRICSGPRPTPTTARHLLFKLHPRQPMARHLIDEDPGCENRQPRQHLGQTHRKAPSLQGQATATSSAPRNRNISTTAETPTSATTTAHGYMNNISTSKARKTIEARYQRAWNRDSACSWGNHPD